MPISARNGGSFSVARAFVRVAGVWQRAPNVFARVAGVWQQVAEAATVAMPDTSNPQAEGPGAGLCVSGIRFDPDGGYHFSDSTGFYGAETGMWLASGLADDVYIEVAVSGDPLDVAPVGPGRFPLSGAQTYEQRITNTGNSTSTCTFSFYDAAIGGNLLDTAVVSLSVEIAEP